MNAYEPRENGQEKSVLSMPTQFPEKLQKQKEELTMINQDLAQLKRDHNEQKSNFSMMKMFFQTNTK
jgi:hypothetical protein